MTKDAHPRPSATILLVREAPFEVLMVSRHSDQDFSSALVFPGGIVDASDSSDDWMPHIIGAERYSTTERALRIAAFRETFEECGLLLARRRDGAPITITAERQTDFLTLIAQNDAVLTLDDLVPFAHWITPVQSPRRYDTHFFLAVAPTGQTACCDGTEAVAVEWISPAELVAEAEAGTGVRKVVFPTRMNLGLLARSNNVTDALAAARARPPFTVLPHIEKTDDGIVVRIPAEAGYGVTEERRTTR
ncbi:NUDIX hydrolase [Sphingobium sp. HBC34]|uniref:NUDIX hydrolase n=1 Tax=Sphingobium cyanobacteriorum TaxID=3063954 RepID=A0ABT8ZR00_9SPHN|nr:NUDIX hydrolase [Sphingobium sp. HBC34]MDO7836379.1 NUDIX hydrolase [Sphingobium sp. HBC34]